ncbi:hypothetical protein KCU87_g549, partial [Aureobasidium melanogenum]
MLAINPQTDDEEETCWDELAESVGAFIMSLPQLASVKMIRRYRQRTLDILLNHCGKQLRCLLLALLEDRHKQDSLLFSTMNLAELLRQKCPLLEELAITILGSQGREQEVRIYTNLGRLTRIRKSHLSLHCSQSLLSSRDLQGLEAYDDMTLDTKFAKSIFYTISIVKTPYDFQREWPVAQEKMDNAAKAHFSHILSSVWPQMVDQDWKEHLLEESFWYAKISSLSRLVIGFLCYPATPANFFLYLTQFSFSKVIWKFQQANHDNEAIPRVQTHWFTSRSQWLTAADFALRAGIKQFDAARSLQDLFASHGRLPVC